MLKHSKGVVENSFHVVETNFKNSKSEQHRREQTVINNNEH